MVRKVFIVLLLVSVFLPASSVCAFAHDCGTAARDVVASGHCGDRPEQTTAPGPDQGRTGIVSFSMPGASCCPSMEPSEARPAVTLTSSPLGNDQSAPPVWLVQRIEASVQPSHPISLNGLVSSLPSPRQLYCLYSSYLI